MSRIVCPFDMKETLLVKSDLICQCAVKNLAGVYYNHVVKITLLESTFSIFSGVTALLCGLQCVCRLTSLPTVAWFG
jgi:hypothetical protein